jgi:hypothetical protein
MKQILLLCTVVLALTACKNATPPSTPAAAPDIETSASPPPPPIALDSLLAQAEALVGQPVRVEGYVTHTCKHSGRRCFLTDVRKEISLRVEAKGKIGGFHRELVGTKIIIDGLLRERRLASDEVDNMEKAIREQQVKNDGSEDMCNAELASITKMREWMQLRGKDYYAIYYIDGLDYREAGEN